MTYRLLTAFRGTFLEKPYIHRNASLGDFVAMHLYEDLYRLGKSTRYVSRVDSRTRVLNVQNQRRGINARRGDGTFGELIPEVTPLADPEFHVARGPVATVEIGVEVKILAKAMLKQIDRVIGDLVKQVAQFKRGAGNPICVGVVGINSAHVYTSFEGERSYTTDGKRYKHPSDEANEAERRILDQARSSFDEFLLLRFRATNLPPYPFEWVHAQGTELDYGSILTRISREYDHRFKNGDE